MLVVAAAAALAVGKTRSPQVFCVGVGGGCDELTARSAVTGVNLPVYGLFHVASCGWANDSDPDSGK